MYVSYIKMLMDFNNANLWDPVSNVFFFPVNTEDDTTVSLTNLGYQMNQEQYLVGSNVPVKTDSSGFALSFWLYPVNPGNVLSEDGSSLETLRMPVIIFSELGTDFSKTVFAVYENTNTDDTNNLEIKIFSYDEYGALDTEYTVFSDSYEELMSHHFFINVSVEKQEIIMYIDGILSTNNTPSGSLPSSFEHELLDVGINKIYETEHAYNLSNNLGIIDDIGFFNLQFDVPSMLDKLINEGLEEFADINLRNKEDFLQATLFDDPTTLKVNAMIDDMSYVYLAMSDGRILYGSPLFWELRRVFSNSNEGTVLDDYLITEASDTVTPEPAEIVNGFLKITDSIVRL